MKVRPCKKGCGYPALKGRQFCRWHALMRESSDIQAQAARARLARAEMSPDYEYVARVPQAQWPSGERWCAGCQTFVPKFYVSGSRCKACVSMAAHGRRLQETYGISPQEYDRIYKLQGGRCAICRNKSRSIRLATDHDHQTQAVRGLLCKRCNHDLLGGAHDSVALLWRALAYLAFPPALREPGEPPPGPEKVFSAVQRHLALLALRDEAKVVEEKPPPF